MKKKRRIEELENLIHFLCKADPNNTELCHVFWREEEKDESYGEEKSNKEEKADPANR